MVNVERLGRIPDGGPFFYFRGCFINNVYPGIEAATRFVFEKLGVDFVVSDDQTCCGTPEFYSLNADTVLASLVGRNTSIISKKTPFVITDCNGCYSSFHMAEALMEDPAISVKVNKILKKIGRKFENVEVIHIADFFYKKIGEIVRKTTMTLGDTKLAVHYGCHYSHVDGEKGLDSVENPSFIEEMILKLKGEPIEYTEKILCCGFGGIQQTVHKTISYAVTQKKLDSISEAVAEAIVVICPYCLNVLDKYQGNLLDVEMLDYPLPVIHLSQLLALLMGAEPRKLGFEMHRIPVDNIINKLTPKESIITQ
ncbi:MAG: CoB--CoM heterodisulfide reductase iron-sulfur subunit B family protein [Candidatus Jordarchaeum sp.]|uniref:CoB--CoM heterodisulfide reductase iron-sulfur subunit B family protein n=1 Tax=Candidatus Jordarchaeum sp. TaxID=2823881 RepID=UPI00404908B0